MAVTSWYTAGTLSSYLVDTGDQGPWAPLTASYLSSDDANYVTNTVSSNALTYTLDCTNFGFDAEIGASDTIDGIEVEVTGHSAGATGFIDATAGPKLVIGGSLSGTAKPTSGYWSSTDRTITYPSTGASTDKWGTSVTATQVRATNFGVGIRWKREGTGGNQASVGFVRMRVYYTAGSGGTFIPKIAWL